MKANKSTKKHFSSQSLGVGKPNSLQPSIRQSKNSKIIIDDKTKNLLEGVAGIYKKKGMGKKLCPECKNVLTKRAKRTKENDKVVFRRYYICNNCKTQIPLKTISINYE